MLQADAAVEAEPREEDPAEQDAAAGDGNLDHAGKGKGRSVHVADTKLSA